MAELGTTGSGLQWRRAVALVFAIAALLAGLLAVTAGGAGALTSLLVGYGLTSAAASQIAIATVSTIPPVILFATLVTTNEDPRGRLVGLAGVAIALTGSAVGITLGFESAVPLVGAIYGGGLLLVLGPLLHGVTGDRSRRSETATSGWTSQSRPSSPVSGGTDVVPADGGEDDEDDDLSFLLEDDEELEK